MKISDCAFIQTEAITSTLVNSNYSTNSKTAEL